MRLQVSAIVSFLLGPERAAKIQIFAGDVVPRKKPDPVEFSSSFVIFICYKITSNFYLFTRIILDTFPQAIYNLAATTLGVEPSRYGIFM